MDHLSICFSSFSQILIPVSWGRGGRGCLCISSHIAGKDLFKKKKKSLVILDHKDDVMDIWSIYKDNQPTDILTTAFVIHMNKIRI